MANYFRYFPTINYTLDDDVSNGKLTTVADITFPVRFLEPYLRDKKHLFQYQIRDGATPESIATKVYGNPQRHWIVMLVNKVIDPRFDWALSSNAFEAYIENKYGSATNAMRTKTLVATDYMLVDEPFPRTLPAEVTANNYMGFQVTVDGVDRTADVVYTWAPGEYEFSPALDNVEQTINFYDLNYHSYYAWTYQSSSTTDAVKVIKTEISKDDWINFVPITGDNPFVFSDGETLTITTEKSAKSYYDWEFEQNDAKRNIWLLNSAVVTTIEEQFRSSLRQKRVG